METVDSFGEERWVGCGRKVWQDADGNIRCTHMRGCDSYAEMSSGKNRHSKRVKEHIRTKATGDNANG